jgi:hypothetical protein
VLVEEDYRGFCNNRSSHIDTHMYHRQKADKTIKKFGCKEIVRSINMAMIACTMHISG